MGLLAAGRALRTVGRHLFVHSGAVPLALRYPPGGVRIVMYHGVSSSGVPVDRFRRQLAFLRRHFESYWVSDLPRLLSGEIQPSRPPVVLTFDDGLRNNATVAAPMLDAHGLKATFYLVAGMLEGGIMIWNHELQCRLWSAPEGAHLPEGVPHLPPRGKGRWGAISRFIQAVKQWPDDRRSGLLAAVRRATPGFRPTPWMREEFEIMSVDEARRLPPGIEVGSHTLTHPILDRLPPDRAREEIAGSRAVLEDKLQREVRTFCYPNGQFSDLVAGLVSENYDAAVTVEQGVAAPRHSIHRLPRIIPGESFEQFVAWLVRPPRLRDGS